MVSYLELFVTFLKIGFIMFGGGYGGVGIMYKELVEERGWISEEKFLAIVGIAESTPGPIAINTATWVGYELKGILGSIIATLAIVIPSYVVILGVVMALRPFMEHYIAKAVFRGINAAVLAVILYALLRLSRSTLFKAGSLDLLTAGLFIIATAFILITRASPVITIALSAILSLLLSLVLGI